MQRKNSTKFIARKVCANCEARLHSWSIRAGYRYCTWQTFATIQSVPPTLPNILLIHSPSLARSVAASWTSALPKAIFVSSVKIKTEEASEGVRKFAPASSLVAAWEVARVWWIEEENMCSNRAAGAQQQQQTLSKRTELIIFFFLFFSCWVILVVYNYAKKLNRTFAPVLFDLTGKR